MKTHNYSISTERQCSMTFIIEYAQRFYQHLAPLLRHLIKSLLQIKDSVTYPIAVPAGNRGKNGSATGNTNTLTPYLTVTLFDYNQHIDLRSEVK